MNTQKFYHIISGITPKLNSSYFIICGLLFGAIILKLPLFAVAIFLGSIITIAFGKKPLGALAVMVFILPFANTALLGQPVATKGTEPIHLVAALVIFIALINIKDSAVMPNYILIFILFFLAVFIIAALRSVSHLDLINWRNIVDGREALSTSSHILKTVVRPLFYFIPLIVILKYVKNSDDIEFMVKIISLAVLLYSICILFIYFFKAPSKNVLEAAQSYGDYLGLQRNDLADHLIIGLPFFIASYFLKKNLFNILSICLCILAIGFTFTRTAYVTTPLAFIGYLIVSKRTKFFPILIAIAFLLTFFVSSVIIERASTGLYTRDINIISAGRVGNQWIPLLQEYFNDPHKLLFGNGRFAIVSSKAVALGLTPDTMLHPHNMYIEQILDAGILSFIIIISFLTFIMLKIFGSLKKIMNKKMREYQYALFVSLASFLISGITGRSLFPSGTNGLFWVVLGLGIVIVRIVKESKQNSEVYQ